MFGITLLEPAALAVGLAVIGLSGAAWWAGFRWRKRSRSAYGEARLIDRFSDRLDARRETLLFCGYALVAALISLAASSPVVDGVAMRVRAGSTEVVVVTDVSLSMASEEYRQFMPDRGGVTAQDFAGAYGSRLDFVKLTIDSRILPALSSNRLGIVTYSGLGFTQAELTHDHTSLRWILRRWMPVGGAPGNGSDFGSGLMEAVRLFSVEETQPVRNRVIVLFSDGGYAGHAQGLSEAVAALARHNVRLIIVGVGGDQPSTIPVYAPSGEMRGNLMRNGQPVLTHFDARPLLSLRDATGGEYVRLAPGDELNIAWASILAGERVEIGQRHLYMFPLSAALFLLALLQVRGVFRRSTHAKEAG